MVVDTSVDFSLNFTRVENGTVDDCSILTKIIWEKNTSSPHIMRARRVNGSAQCCRRVSPETIFTIESKLSYKILHHPKLSVILDLHVQILVMCIVVQYFIECQEKRVRHKICKANQSRDTPLDELDKSEHEKEETKKVWNVCDENYPITICKTCTCRKYPGSWTVQ